MKKLILLLGLFFLVGTVFAADFIPPGDINLKDVYSIKNGVNATFQCINLNNNQICSWGSLNSTFSEFFVNITGDTMTGDLDLSNNSLTNVGKLIMGGLITSYDIIPVTDNLYSLGNSTSWFKELFVNDIYAENIDTSYLNSNSINSSEVNSTDINSENMESTRINSTNLTVAGYEINEKNGNLVITLT